MPADDGKFEYVRNLHMEAIFRSSEDISKYLYSFATFNKNRLQGPSLERIRSYNIYARAIVPITKHENLVMTLFTGKDDSILDFRMAYTRTFSGEDTLFGRKFPRPLGMINVRSDVGPKNPPHPPHIDVQIFDKSGKIMAKDKIKQDSLFPNYECVISAVLIQVETISNPLIGPQYWLSPIEIHPERVILVDQLRKENQVNTPLAVVSRAINIKMYDEVRRRVIDDNKFREIALSQLHAIKSEEELRGGILDVQHISYSTDISILPFLFFKPCEADFGVQAYSADGGKLALDIETLGIVQERNRKNNITRGFRH
jgi:hypothetical protein